MKKLIFTLFMIMCVVKVSAQSSEGEIQRVQVKDKEFIKNITHFIEDLKNGGDEFGFFKKGLGYVSVQVADYHHGDTLLRYSALQQATGFDNGTDDGLYPPYYTLIDGHPVLLYFRAVQMLAAVKYSQRSKSLFRKELNRYLDKPKNVVVYDVDNKKNVNAKNFREEYYKLGSGVVFYKFGRQYEQ